MKYFLVLAVLFSAFQLQAKTHVLKKGETLANVARMYYGEPVWGPKGTINKIYKLNPWALATPNVVEPGQAVVIDDESASAVPAPQIKTEPVPVETAGPVLTKEPTPLPAIEPMPKHEIQSETIPPKVEQPKTEPAPTPVPVVEKPAPPETPKAEVASETKAESAPAPTGPRSYFFISPLFISSKLSVNDDPNTTTYDLTSSSTYGLKLGWDHWWTKSFSTVFSYSMVNMKSTAINDTTTDTFANSINLSSTDLLFLNRLGSWGRFGLGAAYSSYFFVESFTGAPSNPSIYKVSFWHPLVYLQLGLFSFSETEFTLDLQGSPLPADVGHDHDLKSGVEYQARLGMSHSFGKSAFTLGVTYLNNDQARMATQQTRKETILDLGFKF